MLMTIGVWEIFEITFDSIKPAATPRTPPTLVSTAASVENMAQDSALVGAYGVFQADLTGSFRDRHQHNIHNADTAYQK